MLSDATVKAITGTDIPVMLYGFYEYSDGASYWCEPISASYASGAGTTVMEGFGLSADPFTRSLCKGHAHENK